MTKELQREKAKGKYKSRPISSSFFEKRDRREWSPEALRKLEEDLINEAFENEEIFFLNELCIKIGISQSTLKNVMERHPESRAARDFAKEILAIRAQVKAAKREIIETSGIEGFAYSSLDFMKEHKQDIRDFELQKIKARQEVDNQKLKPYEFERVDLETGKATIVVRYDPNLKMPDDYQE